MTKYISFIAVAIMCCTLISCSNDGSNETRAGIMAEEFVKQDVISHDDLEFELIGVDKEAVDEYHAVANIKTLNGLGFKVPRKISIRLRYKGHGDWTDINNWTKIRISYLNEATGETQTSTEETPDNDIEAFNEAQDGEVKTICGIRFNVLFKNEYSENVASEKRLSESQVKQVCRALDGKDIFFYVNGATASLADCYAHKIGDLIEYGDHTLK